MGSKRWMTVFTAASQMGFPFPDPEQGRPAASDPDVSLIRFTRRRDRVGPGIFLGCSKSDVPCWHLEFEVGLLEPDLLRCLKVLDLPVPRVGLSAGLNWALVV